ncbi:MAG: restriction endonuclease subunit S [Vicingaceae bacterium]
MSNWEKIQIGKAISFNPPESIQKGALAKKIPMGMLTEFQRKINGYEIKEYSAGPKFRNFDTVVAKITPCLENGKTAFVDILEKDEVAYGSSEFIVLRKTKYTESEFIYYLAISPTFRNRAISCMEGTSGRKRVDEKTLRLFELPFPDLNTQTQIAKVLSDLDAKIELNNKINAELEGMAKLIYDYWFVQFEFPFEASDFVTQSTSAGSVESGVEGDQIGKPKGYKSSGGKMVYNEELKREIPEGWKVKELKKEMDVQYGFPFGTEYFSDNSNGLPVVRIRDILNRTISTYSSQTAVDIKYKLEEGDLLIGMDGNFHLNFWNQEGAYLNQRCLRIRKKDNSSISLFQTLFSIKPYIKAREKNVSRTTVAHLSARDVNDLRVLIPNSKFLKKQVPLFDDILKKTISNSKQNQHLSSLRDWLLPMLMNGQVSTSLDLTKHTSLSSRAESKETRKGYEKMEEVEFGRAAEGETNY